MEDKTNQLQRLVGGRIPGGEGGAGGQTILPPNAASQQGPSLQAQWQDLTNQQRTLMQMGPLAGPLMKLGVTPQQMMQMNPSQAYQFIQARSPGGMGARDMAAERAVMETINKIRAQRGILESQMTPPE